MKNFLLAMLLAFTLNTAHVPKADAAIGALHGNVALALSGIGVAATGLGLSALAKDNGIMFFVGIVWGVIMLDGDEVTEIDFSEISAEQADEANLTQLELEAYNKNLDEIEHVTNEIARQLGEDATIEDSQKLWKEYSTYLDHNAYEALQKLAVQ